MSIEQSPGVASVCRSVAERPLGGAHAAERYVARPRTGFSTLDPMQRPSAPRRWSP